jgi:hypothetical protein
VALSRRRFLELAASLPGFAALGCAEPAPDDGWERGPLRHLLPLASHEAFNLKASFVAPLAASPALRVGDARVPGERMDTQGRFCAFRAGGLAPGTEYTLRLERGAAGGPLCGAWPLRTLPAPDARPERLRVAAFTCAGGAGLPLPPSLFEPFKPIAYRQRLFELMLEREPHLVIANGDHVYFDLAMMDRLRARPLARLLGPFLADLLPAFDPAAPVLGTANEAALTAVGDDQIASLYGVRFRSTPVFFVTDDHDYFENDDATPERVTLPPDEFHRALRNTLQRLYLPELLAGDDGHALPDRVAHPAARLATHFGRARYGDLASILFYDCGGFLSLGEGAGLVPPGVEAWLTAETRREDTRHLVHVPSHPLGFTAGKWREWYPDRLESRGSVVAAVGADAEGGKYLWQPGWWAQHQRLLAALSAQSRRRAVMVSGDLHALGAVEIEASGALDLRRNPVLSVLAGPVGVGEIGWPSRARGVTARTPEALRVASLLALEERNGFSLLDFDRASLRIETLGCPPGYVAPGALTLDRPLALERGVV